MAAGFLSALVLAIVQGFTEWFPISSSGHLVLFQSLLGYSGGLLLETALHFGTLMAVFVYFGKDITDILRDFFSGRWKTENGRMAWLLIVASIPAGIVGFLAKDYFDSVLSNLYIVAFGFGITGLLLVMVSFLDLKSHNLSVKSSFLIGIAQAISIIPGISRSGSTMGSGIILGLSEKNAMKFSFLMAIPVILGANILTVGSQVLPINLLWATLVSFLVGLISIHVVFKYLLASRNNYKWFGFYCLALALGILVWLSFA